MNVCKVIFYASAKVVRDVFPIDKGFELLFEFSFGGFVAYPRDSIAIVSGLDLGDRCLLYTSPSPRD